MATVLSMNILQIAPPWIDTPPPEYGGTEQVIYNLVKGLQTLGHKVTLYATKKSQTLGKLKYIYAKSLLDQDMPWEAALPALIHYHQAFKLAGEYDIVHAHLSSQTDIMTLPFLADLADANIPAILTIHGHVPFDRFSFTDATFLKLYGAKVFVINISQAMVPFTPAPFKQIGVVHNSIDVSKLKYHPRRGRYLTWLGKIVPDKNVSEAIMTAKAAGIPIVFGGVVDKHNPYSVQYFESKVKPLIDGKQVIYLGPVNEKTKSRLLGNAVGFLYPILWDEPFGMVMIEAMATGTPVIAYPRGAAPELVVHGETGFLVSNRDKMMAAIEQLPSVNRQACRDHVVNHFSPKDAARNHVASYAKVIQKYVSLPATRPFSQSVDDFVDSLDYLWRSISVAKKTRRSSS